MTRSADSAVQAEKIAELKRLITTGSFETLEKLEEAVDAFLWADDDDDDENNENQPFDPRSLAPAMPK